MGDEPGREAGAAYEEEGRDGAQCAEETGGGGEGEGEREVKKGERGKAPGGGGVRLYVCIDG